MTKNIPEKNGSAQCDVESLNQGLSGDGDPVASGDAPNGSPPCEDPMPAVDDRDHNQDTTSEVIIDEEIRNLIPPLSDEEYAKLEENLIASGGARDALVLWNGILIDGHNRFKICKARGLPFKTTSLDHLQDRKDVKIWIIDNQVGRRNLPEIDRIDLVRQRENLLKQKGLEKKKSTSKKTAESQRRNENGRVLSNLTKHGEPMEAPHQDSQEQAEPPVNTRKEMAQMAGVSEGNFRKGKIILEKGSPDQIERLRNKETSIDHEYKKISKEKGRVYATTVISDKRNTPHETRFCCIVICPPTNADSKKELKNLPINAISDEDSHLFVWTSQDTLEAHLKLMKGWGFSFKRLIVWNKLDDAQPGPRSDCEFVIYGRKGGAVLDENICLPTSFFAPAGEPEMKPDEFYEIVREASAGPRLEIHSPVRHKGFETFESEDQSMIGDTINASPEPVEEALTEGPIVVKSKAFIMAEAAAMSERKYRRSIYDNPKDKADEEAGWQSGVEKKAAAQKMAPSHECPGNG